MNKAHLLVAAFSLVMGSAIILPGLHMVFAQYTSGQAAPGGVTLEEQLKLAREKISNAQQQGAYGSGTSMFGYNFDNTVIMIIVVVAILGGVAAAFFAAGRSGPSRHVETTSSGTYTTGKFCTNCGYQLGESQKFCGNCGAKS